MEGIVSKGKLEFSPETGVFALIEHIGGKNKIDAILLFLLLINASSHAAGGYYQETQTALDLRVLAVNSR